MTSWILRLFSARRPPTTVRPASVCGASAPAPLPAPVAHPGPATPPLDAASIDLHFAAWLLTGAANAASPLATGGPEAPLDARQRHALARLDHLIGDSDSHKSLLPRAPAVVPQLLARLRSDASTQAELVEQVSRDVILVAEVIRMANSPVYRRDEAVMGLPHAIRLLGADGLRRAIARAVLQPLIDVRGSEFLTRCAQRLWQLSDPKAQLCAVLARERGLDPFEGYLLGLVHNAAWAVVLRGIDSDIDSTPWRVGTAFVAALGARRDRLLAVIAQRWQLSDALQSAAAEVARSGLGAAASAHGQILCSGDRLASLLRGTAAADTAALLLADCASPIRDCFLALTRAAAPLKGRPAAAHAGGVQIA